MIRIFPVTPIPVEPSPPFFVGHNFTFHRTLPLRDRLAEYPHQLQITQCRVRDDILPSFLGHKLGVIYVPYHISSPETPPTMLRPVQRSTFFSINI